MIIDTCVKHYKVFVACSKYLKSPIQLMPSNCKVRSLSIHYRGRRWLGLKSKFINREGRCDICRLIYGKDKLVLHECWDFDFKKKIQRLVGFKTLCKKCHACISLHCVQNWINIKEKILIDYFIRINDIDYMYFNEYIIHANEASKYYSDLSNLNHDDWRLDLSYIDGQRYLGGYIK